MEYGYWIFIPIHRKNVLYIDTDIYIYYIQYNVDTKYVAKIICSYIILCDVHYIIINFKRKYLLSFFQSTGQQIILRRNFTNNVVDMTLT